MTNWEIASVFGLGVAIWALYKLLHAAERPAIHRDIFAALGSGSVSFLVVFVMLQMTLGSV